MGRRLRWSISLLFTAVLGTAGVCPAGAQSLIFPPPPPFVPNIFPTDRSKSKPVLPTICLAKQCSDLMSQVPDLEKACNASVKVAKDTHEKVHQTRKEFWFEVGNAAAKVGSIGTQNVTLYEFNAEASLTYNVYAGTAWYQYILPSGINAEKGRVNSSKDGNYSVPNMDAKAVVSNTGFVEAKLYNSYDDWAIQKKAPPDRYVYVASKRFVDTVSLEYISQDVGWAIFTEGSTAGGSAETLNEQLVLEWTDILNWLREVGKDSSEKLAGDIVKAILNNKFKTGKIHLPNVSVDVEVINYKYEVRPTVAEEVRDALAKIGYQGKIIPSKIVQVPHLVFSFSIEKPQTLSPTDYEKLLSKFVDLLRNGPPAMDVGLADKISNLFGIDRKKADSFLDAGGGKSIRATFVRTLSNALAEAHKRHKGGGVFDFTDSNGAKDLAKILRDNLMIGNARDAKVKRLIIDVVNGSVSVDVDLVSKHELSKAEILKGLDALWKEKDELEKNSFTAALGNEKKKCDELHKVCQGLSDWFTSPPGVCGRDTRERALALQVLPNPVPKAGAGDEVQHFALISQANAHYNNQNYDSAITYYTAAMEIKPMYALSFNNRGLAYSGKKDYDQAIEDHGVSIKIATHADAFSNRGIAYYWKKDYDRAIADQNMAITLDPKHSRAFSYRGAAYYEKGNYDQAIADYSRAIFLGPSDASMFHNRGLAYSFTKEYGKAISDYNSAILLDPKHAFPFYGRGNMYYETKDYNQAIADYSSAIARDPKHAFVFTGRGNAYYVIKYYDHAIADFNSAIGLDPNHAAAWAGRGAARQMKGDSGGQADISKALQLNAAP